MSRFAQSTSSRTRAVTAALAALAVVATATLFASPSVASAAQPAADGYQTNVYYNLRDLSTEQGTRLLYRRLVSAARSVCPGYDSRWADAVAVSKECQREAMARAIGQIGNARLAALDARDSSWRG